MSILVKSDHLPAAERFALYREAMATARMAPVEIHAEHEADFRFSLRYRDLGALRATVLTAMPYTVRRTPTLIRRSDPDVLTVGMVVRGHATISQNERQSDVPAGTFAVYDATRPFDIRMTSRTGSVRGVILHFPRALLPLPPRHLAQLLAMPMGASPGVGALTTRLLTQLATDMEHYGPAEAVRLSTTALDVLATRLSHELDGGVRLPAETHKQALVTRIHAFIEQHIGDPALAPAAIAEAHHISLRYLHRLFAAQGSTVAGWIRRRRLEGCRRDPADPALAGRPVVAIAARWGFDSAAHFSRTFKAAYGQPPQEYRRWVTAVTLNGPGDPSPPSTAAEAPA
jgi:AraC-like DNA-binding protein